MASRSLLPALLTLLFLCAPASAAPGGFLGVYLTENDDGKAGALIEDVAPDSPAAEAGLRRGDFIIRCKGKKIAHSQALIPHLMAGEEGQVLKLRVRRDGWEKVFSVKLAGRSGEAAPAAPEAPPVAPAPPMKERGFLGIYLREGENGEAVVDGILENSPAAAAGLQVDDVLTEVQGKAIAAPQGLIDAVGAFGPGESLTMKLTRGSKAMDLTVTLGRRGESSAAPRAPARAERTPAPAPTPAERPATGGAGYIGFALVDEEGKGPLKVDEVSPNGPAERFGFRSGDVILEVEGQAVKTIEGFVKALGARKAGEGILFKITRDGWKSELRLTLGAAPQDSGE